MYITLDMLADPIFWLGLIPVVFFLGGKVSPLWSSKWYRKFYKAIGLQGKEIVMTKKLAQLLLNNDIFMDNIPLSWGLKLEEFVNGRL